MEIAKIRVYGTFTKVLSYTQVPSGLSGATITIEYVDSIWKDLNKMVVFNGAATKDVVTNDLIVGIPQEVLAEPGKRFQIGFIGTDAEKNLIVPTLWSDLGVIRQGTDSSGDTTTDESMPVWAQVISIMDDVKKQMSELEKGLDGKDGFSPIATVKQTDDGAVISITDASGTTTANIANGEDGADGKDGTSPSVTVLDIAGGHRVTFTDSDGPKTIDVMDGKDGDAGEDGRGIVSVKRTAGNGAPGTTDTYTMTFTDGATSTFTVYNGADGKDGSDGSGSGGSDGEDGATFTPHVDANGNLSWSNDKGLDNPETVNIKGSKGDDGSDGTSATHSWNGTVLTISSASGTSSSDLKGDKGDKGDKGETGLQGPAYKLTDTDKSEMVSAVIAALPVYNGEVEEV